MFGLEQPSFDYEKKPNPTSLIITVKENDAENILHVVCLLNLFCHNYDDLIIDISRINAFVDFLALKSRLNASI